MSSRETGGPSKPPSSTEQGNVIKFPQQKIKPPPFFGVPETQKMASLTRSAATSRKRESSDAAENASSDTYSAKKEELERRIKRRGLDTRSLQTMVAWADAYKADLEKDIYEEDPQRQPAEYDLRESNQALVYLSGPPHWV